MSNPSPNPSQSVRSQRANSITEPLYQVRLLNALRRGDPALIHPFLAEIGKERQDFTAGQFDTGAAALHLAIRCASADTVRLLLSQRAISPNAIHPVGSGTTALHLAASLGRSDVVNILLEQSGIDDTARDNQGRTCREVAKSRSVIRAIDDSRTFLNASYRSLLRSYILSPPDVPPSDTLINLLESPRVRLVDLSYLDNDSGRSLLHEAAKKKDLRLIDLAIRAGADVFVRDRRGKTPGENLGKDDRVRVFLRQFANQDNSLIASPSSTPTNLRGYLNKYTNVARGYNTRWFVLKDGVLSYYRHQEDENIASRGAISLKTAIIKAGLTGDKTRFEVHSTPSKGHTSGVQKWFLKANHPVEASRWLQALNKSMQWCKREAQNERQRNSLESEISGLRGSSLKSSVPSIPFRRDKRTSVQGSPPSSLAETADGSGDRHLDIDNRNEAEERQSEEEANNDDSSSSNSSSQFPPHEADFELHGNSIIAQVELTAELLSNFTVSSDASAQSRALEALTESLTTIQSMTTRYVEMAKDRDEWWSTRLRREQGKQSALEESLLAVVREGEVLEKELRMRSRKRGSRFFDTSINEGGSPLRHRPPSLALTSSRKEASSSYFAPAGNEAITSPALLDEDRGAVDSSLAAITPTQRMTQELPSLASPGIREYDDEADTEEEDEFFDAIETNALPNLVVSHLLTSPAHSQHALPIFIDVESFVGYRNLRTGLPISSDNRPSTSLWSVLRHSIGKDLTRISFPVFFNEPTSMLQRMAEDMEFSECLDVAVNERDPHRRIAFVAAFAMSNYSSTIGRIAKPFNPMLSETFEYVRVDKDYRYVSEQVSHHPPISACWAEAPCWHYYGEVDAQNKFMGKSFEIRPTGVAHAELLIPEEWGPLYPKYCGVNEASRGKVIEHFTWKKVTTSVSGFLLGSPTIDHYGEMTIINHRTGDRCILTFKPRGWRGKDAYEISGYVEDANGNVTYEIAGRWNSQLICRAVGTGSGLLNPDASLTSPTSGPEYILLWRNSEKPKAPFNLTPFAITLNDCPQDTLRPFIAPTDCRLRPDQRAFEMGRYELANELKNKQEEKQRATRKAREEGRLSPHKPRWFTAETDGDTGERVWSPSRIDGLLEYWLERERVWKLNGNTEWKDVDHIFIEDTL